jgi:hypothetical protein
LIWNSKKKKKKNHNAGTDTTGQMVSPWELHQEEKQPGRAVLLKIVLVTQAVTISTTAQWL